MWRDAREADEPTIVEHCLALNADDPGPQSVSAHQVMINGQVAGYALLVAFWSNELGGDVCVVDELYVTEEHRGCGHGCEVFRGHEVPATQHLGTHV